MSLQLLGDHLWQSTLFAGAAGLLALLLRRNGAAVRYWVWLAASVKFLIPFAALVALGSQFQWRSAPIIAQPTVAVIHTISQPFSHVDFTLISSGAGPAASTVPLSTLMLIAWLAGCLVILSRWRLCWRRVAAVARDASVITRGREFEILRSLEQGSRIGSAITFLSTHSPLEPGIFGIFRPVLLWPQHMIGRLDDAQVEAIIAHEVSHVRRRDNLLASIHMIVEAIFWFHPLVWWVGARLVDERERACDEEVVRLGSAPHVYAESILKTCEFCIEAPLANIAGVTGSDLKRRIGRIMKSVGSRSLGAGRKCLLVLAASVAIGGPLVTGVFNVSRVQAQSTLPSATTPAFEVVSIKINRSGDQSSRLTRPPGRFEAMNVTLGALIRRAYRLQEFQLSEGPRWITSERFDIAAKTDGEAPVGQLELMLQALLAERFSLVMHKETKDVPVYALLLTKGNGE